MVYTFDRANANAPSTHHTQYFEMMGLRALYHDGWIASTLPYRAPWDATKQPPADIVNGVTWELFDLTKDWTQNNNLAAANPAKLKQLQDLFWVEAQKYQVLPLDASALDRFIVPKPSIVAGRTEFTYPGPIVGIPQGTAPSVLNRSFTITANVEVTSSGTDGMLATAGGRFGGWAFYVLGGKPVFTYNLLDLSVERVESKQRLSSGKHTVVFDFNYDGPGLAKGGTGVITIDGTETARQQIKHTIPFSLASSETFDVGSDTGTGVYDNDYQPPFAFSGKLKKLTIKLGLSGMTASQQAEAQERAAAMQD
jgi:hypothetical protein